MHHTSYIKITHLISLQIVQHYNKQIIDKQVVQFVKIFSLSLCRRKMYVTEEKNDQGFCKELMVRCILW